MWFGDYVIPAVVERYLAQRIVRVVDGERDHGGIAPGLAARRVALAPAHNRAMEFDRLSSTRRIRQPVTEYGEVRAAFDSITYAKGESILAMFEQWLGPEKFREGVAAATWRSSRGATRPPRISSRRSPRPTTRWFRHFAAMSSARCCRCSASSSIAAPPPRSR